MHKNMHTINKLDVEAIRRAMVAIINFPASGFACKCNSDVENLKDFDSKIHSFCQHSTNSLTSESTLPNPTFAG